jgi:hypothetical protein
LISCISSLSNGFHVQNFSNAPVTTNLPKQVSTEDALTASCLSQDARKEEVPSQRIGKDSKIDALAEGPVKEVLRDSTAEVVETAVGEVPLKEILVRYKVFGQSDLA